MKHSIPATEQFQQKLERRALKQATFNVLAVDDEPGVLELLETGLSAFKNCHVTEAGSASEALWKIKTSKAPFDCILLDIQMPGTNGIQLLRKIRSLPDNSETPVIMLTAMSDRQHVEDAFAEGAFDYITKPFDFFELRSRMNAAHLLMQERIRAKRTMASVKTLKEKLDYNRQFSFEDPLSIGGPKRCLGYVEFDDYVEDLSRSRLFDSSVTAVKLQDAEYRYDMGDFGSFRRAITDIGFCIGKSLKDADAIFAYRGAGIFLIVTHGRDSTDMLPTEEILSRKLGMVLSTRGASAHLRTVMSSPVPMRSLSKAGALAALKTAAEYVNNREQALRKGAVPRVHTGSDYEAEQKERASPRLFEKALHDLYGQETYLSRK